MFDRAGLFYLKEGVRFCSIKVLKGFGKCIATFKVLKQQKASSSIVLTCSCKVNIVTLLENLI